MKFDVVVGNPPYKGFACLHQRFFNRGVEKLKDEGHIVFIQPATPYYNKKGTRRENIKMLSNLRKYEAEVKLIKSEGVFGDVYIGSDIAITSLKKTLSKCDEITFTYPNGTSYRSKVENINGLSISPDAYESIKDKYMAFIDKNGALIDLRGDENSEVKGAFIPSYSFSGDQYYTMISNNPDHERIHDSAGIKMVIDLDQFEFFYGYIKTFVARFGLSLRKTNINLDRGELKSVPLVPFDRLWTDEELARLIGLTDEELEIIIKSLPDYHNLLN